MTEKQSTYLLKVVIHLAALYPLIYTFFLAFSDQLGGDPVKALIHFTGIGAFNLLLLSLAVSPVARLLRKAFIMQVRRLVGLYAFTYAFIHILSFFAFELLFDITLFVNELIERPYILVGMAAFIILLSMAITSINSLKRKMRRHWQTLHNFVYLAVPLVAIHFYWSVKSDVVEPIIYMLITLSLLGWRKNKILRWFK